MCVGGRVMMRNNERLIIENADVQLLDAKS